MASGSYVLRLALSSPGLARIKDARNDGRPPGSSLSQVGKTDTFVIRWHTRRGVHFDHVQQRDNSNTVRNLPLSVMQAGAALLRQQNTTDGIIKGARARDSRV